MVGVSQKKKKKKRVAKKKKKQIPWIKKEAKYVPRQYI
jgi:hypothetical protein